MIHYRLATQNDISSLVELRWQHELEEVVVDEFRLDKAKFMVECSTFLLEGLENGTWVYWIAEEDGEMISNIYINRIRKVPKPNKFHAEIGYITNVHTIKTYRNQGIGTQLLKHAKEWAKAAGFELLFLWPSKKSVEFYEREGFLKENDVLELEFCEE